MKRGIWWSAVAVALGISVLLELLFHDPAHAELPWHRIPAFDFFFGVAGCALIVIFSKWLGHTFLQRDEDYYDTENDG